LFDCPLRSVVFDIGDTLVDATRIEKTSLERVMGRLGLSAQKHPFPLSYRRVAGQWVASDHNRLFGLPFEMFQTAWRAAGIKDKDAHVGWRVYQTCVRARIRPRPRLTGLFRTLKERGLRLGIVSDGTTPEQEETLQRLGVLTYLDAMVVSDTVGATKPDPRLFERVLEDLGISPADARAAVYVGDNWERDVEGAHQSRMRAVYVVRETDALADTGGVPVIRFRELHKLLNLLDQKGWT